MTDFTAQLQEFRPANLGEQALFAESLTQLNTLLALRSSRLASVNSGIPDILWAVVLIGALVNIIFIWMINTEGHIHIIITGTLSAFLGLVIFLIAAMDYPFRGEVSVDAAPFEQVYTMVMDTEQTAN
jgi:protein-S-isoprenylcysteine O-methyltransferase Ste14